MQGEIVPTKAYLRLGLFCAAALIVCFQIFVPPVIGLAGNGDFAKIVAPFSLGSPPEDEYRFADLKLTFNPRYHWHPGFASSETELFFLALGLNGLLTPEPYFDIRCIGAVHAALLLLAFYFALPLFHSMPPRRFLALAGFALLVFTDVFYVSGLNSFYMDTAAFLFLLLALVFYLRAALWRDGRDRLVLLIAAVLLAATKTQHILTALLIAVLLLWKGNVLGGGKLFRGAAAGSVLAAIILTNANSPKSYSAGNVFDVIFLGILPHSRNVSGDLAQLGLDDDYRQYIGMHTFSDGSPMGDRNFVEAFHSRASYGRLIGFYVRHPLYAYGLICEGMNGGGRPRPILGNYDPGAGRPAGAESHAFSLWSGFKGLIFYGRGSVYLFFALATLSGICGSAIRMRLRLPRGMVEGMCFLSSMVVLEMLVASLGAFTEPTRHFYFFNALLDCAIVCGVAVGVCGSSRKALVSWAEKNGPA